MLIKESNGVRWLEFELLAQFEGVKHGCFLRHGGSSEGAFASLNVGENVGDAEVHVAANRQKVAQVLGVPGLVSVKQCHGSDMTVVTSAQESPQTPCDAIVTQHTGVGLMICHADCQAAIFYDPVQRALANVHCGWRGNVHNIYGRVVDRMGRLYGSRAENLIVCISPSLGPDSAEFIHYQQELPPAFWEFRSGAHHFDFWDISRWQLEAAGVLAAHIQIASIDTYAHPEDYFSYRYARTCGRHATVCALTGPRCIIPN